MKPSVKYGLLNGAVGILFALLMYITGLNRQSAGQWIQMLGLAIPIIFMTMCIKEYRLQVGGGWITFGKAFRQAFTVGFIGGVLGIVFHFLYLTVIDPSFIAYQMQLQEQKFIDKGMSDEMIEQAMKQTAPFMTPPMQVVFGLLMVLFVALVLSLIVAGITKKPNPEEIA